MSEQPNTIHSPCALDTTACAVPAESFSSGLMRALSCCLRRAAPAVALVLSAAWLAPAQAEKPYSFWHSQPVKPGETVLIQGHGFDANTTVQIQRLADGDAGSPGTPLSCPGEGSVTLLPHRTDGGAALSPTNLYFTLPKNINGSSENGVFVYCLKNGNEVSAPKLINRPDIWFVQGDLGSRATTGGWVAVYGNGLSVEDGGRVAKLEFRPAPGEPATLQTVIVEAVAGDVDVTSSISGSSLKGLESNPLQGNAYAQYFRVPAVLPGKYQIHLHNGHGDSQAWTKFDGYELDNKDTIEIVDHTKVWTWMAENAAVNDPANFKRTISCTDSSLKDMAFQDAINALTNGGVIEVTGNVPCRLSKALVMRDHIILRGAGMDATTLLWEGPILPPSSINDKSNPKNALVYGRVEALPKDRTATFAISDLTLERGHTLRQQYDAGLATNRKGVVCIERWQVWDEAEFAYFRKIRCKTINGADDGVVARSQDFQIMAAIWIQAAQNTEITDSELNQASGIFMNGQGDIDSRNFAGRNKRNTHLNIARNTIKWRLLPLVAYKSLYNLAYTHNHEEMQGNETENKTSKDADIGGGFGSFRHNQRDLYLAHNTTSRQAGGGTPTDCAGNSGASICPNLGWTLDGNSGAYFGRLAQSAVGTQLKLANPMAEQTKPGQGIVNAVQRGAMVQIVQGKGEGQWRHLESNILKSTGCFTVDPDPNVVNDQYIECPPVDEITVDRDWDVPPDETSWINITDYQGRIIFHDNDYATTPKLQSYFATNDVIVANNKFGTAAVGAGVGSWTGAPRGGEHGSIVRGWGYQVLGNLVGHQGASFYEGVNAPDNAVPPSSALRAVPDIGFHYIAPAVDAVNGFVNNAPATHVYRNNRINSETGLNAGGSYWHELASFNEGFLLDGNTGLTPLRSDGVSANGLRMITYRTDSLTLPGGPAGNVAVLRDNKNEENNLAQQTHLKSFREDYPADAGESVLLLNSSSDVVNLARSGFAITYPGDNGGFSVLDRVRPIDGDTGGNWAASGGLGTTGKKTGTVERWFEVDLRHQADITEVRVWPRTDSEPNRASDLMVLVSDQPFTSPGTLATEVNKPGVSSYAMAGSIENGGRSVSVQRKGRYVRVWKTVASDAQLIQLAEIEVMGRALRANLDVTVEPSRYDVALNEYVDFTATVTNYGPQSVDGLQISGLSSCVLSPTALGVVASDNTATCTSSEYANEFGRLERIVNVSTSQDLNGEFSGSGSAFVNVQAELKLVRVNATGSVATVPARSPRSETVNGSITITDRLFPGNSTVQLIATPDSGHAVAWTDCTVDTVDPNKCTVVMNAQKVVYANFSPVASSANIAVAASAAPSSVALNSNISYTFTVSNAGPQTATNVTLTTGTLPAGTSFISASAGCTFASGIVTCAMGSINNGASFPVTITLKADTAGTKTLSASATRTESDPDASNNTNKSASATVNPVTLSIVVSGVGTVTSTTPPNIISCTGTGDCSESFNTVTSVTLTASPANGYALGSWSGCDSVSGTFCTVNVNATKSVNAKFVLQGLMGKYYQYTSAVNPTTSDIFIANNLKLTRVDPSVNFNWGSGNPGVGLLNDRFGVRWTGFLVAPATGAYTICLRTDDGSRVYLNGLLIVNDWSDHAARESCSASQTLTAGQKYSIQMDYYEKFYQASAVLSWKTPGNTAAVVIPASALVSE